jgi:methylthioribose-1-phosphate isomerase
MSAVNDLYVLLGSSSSKFLAPVKVGDVVLCKATVVSEKGKKRVVEVEAFVSDNLVFEGSFTTFVLNSHVLEN